jgi:hypothetical protein
MYELVFLKQHFIRVDLLKMLYVPKLFVLNSVLDPDPHCSTLILL